MGKIGEAFADELETAGLLGLRYSWGDDGKVEYGDDLSPEQRAAIAAVLAAHDPAKPREAARVRREARRAALVALVGNDTAEAALDGFLRSIKNRPDLPSVVAQYIATYGV
jgi:hypothetical protein